MLDPKKGNVKTATNILQNEFYKQPQSLLFLIQLIISHDSTELKQLAATQARPLVPKHWTKTPTEQRQHARTQLLQATLSEESSLARHSAARLISSIAKVDLEDGEWPELPGFLTSRHQLESRGMEPLASICSTVYSRRWAMVSVKNSRSFLLFSTRQSRILRAWRSKSILCWLCQKWAWSSMQKMIRPQQEHFKTYSRIWSMC